MLKVSNSISLAFDKLLDPIIYIRLNQYDIVKLFINAPDFNLPSSVLSEAKVKYN